MKPNKYNPKIPKKGDGQSVGDWKHPEFRLRVTIYVTPIKEEVKNGVPLQLMYGRYIFSSIWWDQYTYNYDTAHKNNIEALQNLMPGPYRILETPGREIITVYCNEWLDPIVVKLSYNADTPTSLERANVETRLIPRSTVASYAAQALVSRLKVCY